MKNIYTKIIAIFFVILVIADLLLMIFGRIKPIVFWIIIIVCAIMAYKVLPSLRKI